MSNISHKKTLVLALASLCLVALISASFGETAPRGPVPTSANTRIVQSLEDDEEAPVDSVALRQDMPVAPAEFQTEPQMVSLSLLLFFRLPCG